MNDAEDAATSRPRRRQRLSIQYLRGFAAAIVVVFHILAESGRFDAAIFFTPGSDGVDIFFVISGFVMYTAARHEDLVTFYKRRLVRIAPLYWIATLAAVAVHLLLTGAAISRLNLVKSMAFVPFFNPSFDDRIWSLLVPGWTLNYEMFFYVLFGLSLCLRRPMVLVWLVLPALVALGACFPLHSAAWQTYTSPLLLEFAAGIAIGRAVKSVDLGRCAPLLPIGIVALLLSDRWTLPTILYVGPVAVAIVVGAIGVEAGGRLPSWRSPGCSATPAIPSISSTPSSSIAAPLPGGWNGR